MRFAGENSISDKRAVTHPKSDWSLHISGRTRAETCLSRTRACQSQHLALLRDYVSGTFDTIRPGGVTQIRAAEECRKVALRFSRKTFPPLWNLTVVFPHPSTNIFTCILILSQIYPPPPLAVLCPLLSPCPSCSSDARTDPKWAAHCDHPRSPAVSSHTNINLMIFGSGLIELV